MKSIRFGVFLCALVAYIAAATSARAARVDLSLNVFRTILASPNSGGMWRLVAKTDAPLGIAGISAFFVNVNAGVMVESDINSTTAGGGLPFQSLFGAVRNVVYGQDTSTAPILTGVGRPALSDGPDPFGDIFWDGATWIFKGTYSAQVPAFGSVGASTTAANVLIFTTPGNPAQAADVTTVVRVAVPEPSTWVIAASPLLALAVRLRKQSA